MTSQPLAGRRLLVTRRPEQSGELVAGLRALGAEVLELPTIALAPPADPSGFDRALRDLAAYDWLVLTSANSVAAVAERLRALELAPPPAGKPAGACVGPATAVAAQAQLPWLRLALQPEGDYRAEGLLQAFDGLPLDACRVLLPLSDRARDALAQGLGARGARVDAPVAYRTVAPAGLRAGLERALAAGVTLTLFASPSALENVKVVAADLLVGLPVAAIGPLTERAARAAGCQVRAVARPSTVAGLLHALGTEIGI